VGQGWIPNRVGNDVLLVGNDVLLVGNDVLLVGNDVLLVGNDGGMVPPLGKLLPFCGKVWEGGRGISVPTCTAREANVSIVSFCHLDKRNKNVYRKFCQLAIMFNNWIS